MLQTVATELIIIILLLIANGVFAASELALVSVRRSRLEQQAALGDRRAQQALELLNQPDQLLATVQIGITLIGTFAAAFGGAKIGAILAELLRSIGWLAPYAETVALALVVMLITYLSLILGELVPKRLALINAERVARTFAPLLIRLAWLTRPVVGLLTRSSNAVMWLLRQQNTPINPVTEDDIMYLAREGRAGGTVTLHEQRLIERVFNFTDRTARMIMTPRLEMATITQHTPLTDIARTFIDYGYSRLPVQSSDDPEQILGIVHVKDVLRALLEPAPPPFEALLNPPVYVLDREAVATLLTRFRREGIHMALVVDEYGQIAGLLTLEDVLEELVGDIRDEYDQPDDQPIVQRDDGSWLVDGAEAWSNVVDQLALPAHPDDADGFVTVAGLVLTRLGHLPVVGDSVQWGNYIIEVVDLDGRRVDKVLISPAAESDQSPAESAP